MKRAGSMLFIIAILLSFLCVPIRAQLYVDECQDAKSRQEVSYLNFADLLTAAGTSDFSQWSGWSGCGDESALAMTAKNASALYRVSDAARIKLEIYSNQGTFATLAEGNAGELRLGLKNASEFGSRVRCRYSPSLGFAYVRRGSEIHELRKTRFGFQFQPVECSVHDEDPFYGVNLEASTDGVHFHKVTPSFHKADWQKGVSNPYFREFYEADLPEGTSQIRVTLVGVDLAGAGRGFFPYLSRVEIEQAPPPPPPESEAPSEPSNPTEPSEPSAPSGPSEPSKPTEPSGPSAPSEPSEPSGPSLWAGNGGDVGDGGETQRLIYEREAAASKQPVQISKTVSKAAKTPMIAETRYPENPSGGVTRAAPGQSTSETGFTEPEPEADFARPTPDFTQADDARPDQERAEWKAVKGAAACTIGGAGVFGILRYLRVGKVDK